MIIHYLLVFIGKNICFFWIFVLACYLVPHFSVHQILQSFLLVLLVTCLEMLAIVLVHECLSPDYAFNPVLAFSVWKHNQWRFCLQWILVLALVPYHVWVCKWVPYPPQNEQHPYMVSGIPIFFNASGIPTPCTWNRAPILDWEFVWCFCFVVFSVLSNILFSFQCCWHCSFCFFQHCFDLLSVPAQLT